MLGYYFVWPPRFLVSVLFSFRLFFHCHTNFFLIFRTYHTTFSKVEKDKFVITVVLTHILLCSLWNIGVSLISRSDSSIKTEITGLPCLASSLVIQDLGSRMPFEPLNSCRFFV